MLIINHNCNSGRNGPECQFSEDGNDPMIAAFVPSGLRRNDRRLYVLLSFIAPWSGIAQFYAGRKWLGVIHVFCSLLAIPGIILLVMPLFCPQSAWHPEIGVALLAAALLPWFYSIGSALYWLLQTDEEFQKNLISNEREEKCRK